MLYLYGIVRTLIIDIEFLQVGTIIWHRRWSSTINRVGKLPETNPS